MVLYLAFSGILYMYIYYLVFIISWKRLTSFRDRVQRRGHINGLCINDGPLPSSFGLFVKLFGEGGVMDSLLN